MEKQLLALIIQTRALQLFYHHCHNVVFGEQFHCDHIFFGEAYDNVEDNYDSLVEFFISIFGISKFDTVMVNNLVAEEVSEYSPEKMNAKKMYDAALILEKDFQNRITIVEAKSTVGLKNALGDIAQSSDVRIYKIKQRLKK